MTAEGTVGAPTCFVCKCRKPENYKRIGFSSIGLKITEDFCLCDHENNNKRAQTIFETFYILSRIVISRNLTIFRLLLPLKRQIAVRMVYWRASFDQK
jgi:hypothetical protein